MKLTFRRAALVLALICASSAQVRAQNPRAEALGEAIRKGDLAAVKSALEAEPKLIKGTSRGNVPLYVAIQNGKPEIVTYLLDKGADPNGETYQGSPLAAAISGYSDGWKPMAEALLAKGAKINGVDEDGQTPLLRALGYGGGNNAKEKMEFLIEKGADLTARQRDGRNALESAIYRGSDPLVTLFLEKYDFKRVEEGASPPLFAAISRGNSVYVRQILDKGADINARDAAGDTALHLAAQNPNALLKTLLDAGARTDLKNRRGDLPLHVALRRRDETPNPRDYESETRAPGEDAAPPRGALIAPLTDKSDPNAKDQLGFSPLLLALVARDQESRDLLVERGLKLDATTRLFDAVAQGDLATAKTLLAQKPFLVYFRLPDGSTPLHIAASWGTLGAAQLLTQKGADVNVRDSRGETPLHRAIASSSGLFARRARNMTTFLLGKGADAGALDANDAAPLHRAVKSGDAELIGTLLARKVDLNARDKSGQTPIFALMTKTSPLALVTTLIDGGAQVNIRPTSGLSLLGRAVQTRRVELVSLLLERGADPKARDAENQDALSSIFRSWSSSDEAIPPIAALLIERGADPNARLYGDSPIYRAIQNDAQQLARALLATKKIDLSAYEGRQSPLFQAVNYNRVEISAMLLEAGADVSETDDKSRTLSQIATEKSKEMAAVFAAHAAKAKPN